MFDNIYDDRHMYHSVYCSGTNYGGVVINFDQPVHYADLALHTRSACCREDRYQGICLYADGVQVACTPLDLDEPGDVINFKDYNFNSDAVQARVLKLYKTLTSFLGPMGHLCP